MSVSKRIRLQADIPFPPPELPVCSVMPEQTAGNRLFSDIFYLSPIRRKRTSPRSPASLAMRRLADHVAAGTDVTA